MKEFLLRFLSWITKPFSILAARALLRAPKGWTVCRLIYAAKDECPQCCAVVKRFPGHFEGYEDASDDYWNIVGDSGPGYRGIGRLDDMGPAWLGDQTGIERGEAGSEHPHHRKPSDDYAPGIARRSRRQAKT